MEHKFFEEPRCHDRVIAAGVAAAAARYGYHDMEG